MNSKIKSLKESVNEIKDGMTIAIGGNVLHRAPMAFLREIVRNKKNNLKIVKTAGAHDVDLLCAGSCVATVDAGFISYETEFGLANYYRKAVEKGVVKANEHACYTVMSALRAAKAGLNFMPVSGLRISDLIKENDYFKVIMDPFTGENVTVVKSIKPDIAIIHVHECDSNGNAVIYGPRFDDELISLASKKVILTTEKIVSNGRFSRQPHNVSIPGFLVDTIVVAPKGAAPCSCPTLYDIDSKVLMDFTQSKSTDMLENYLKIYENKDNYRATGVSRSVF